MKILALAPWTFRKLAPSCPIFLIERRLVRAFAPVKVDLELQRQGSSLAKRAVTPRVRRAVVGLVTIISYAIRNV